MQNAVLAQTMHKKKQVTGDPVFSSLFYKPYAAAVETAFLILCAARNQISEQDAHDSVRAMTFRLKSPGSIRDKLARRGLAPSTITARSTLHDIAGLRVVLENVDKVYRFAALLRKSPSLQVDGIRDYIAAPKRSGYRSLHLLMRVPVQLGQHVEMIPIEIQLRTSAMDIWASIEHDICYKPIQPILSV